MGALPNLHPFAVHFPVALVTAALACDLCLVARVRAGWLDRSCVLLYGLGALSAGMAALSGKLAADDLVAAMEPEVSEAVAVHGDWAFFSVVLLFVLAAWRFDLFWRDRHHAEIRVHRLRIGALLLAVVTGWVVMETAARGGALVYRHGVGVEGRGIIPKRR